MASRPMPRARQGSVALQRGQGKLEASAYSTRARGGRAGRRRDTTGEERGPARPGPRVGAGDGQNRAMSAGAWRTPPHESDDGAWNCFGIHPGRARVEAC